MPRLRRAPDTAYREIDGETVVITLRDRRVHVLNETAAAVYDAAVRGGTTADAVLVLCERYDVDEESARRDAESVRNEMVALGLLVAEDRTAKSASEVDP